MYNTTNTEQHKTRHYLFVQLTYLKTNCKAKLRLILYSNLKHERLRSAGEVETFEQVFLWIVLATVTFDDDSLS